MKHIAVLASLVIGFGCQQIHSGAGREVAGIRGEGNHSTDTHLAGIHGGTHIEGDGPNGGDSRPAASADNVQIAGIKGGSDHATDGDGLQGGPGRTAGPVNVNPSAHGQIAGFQGGSGRTTDPTRNDGDGIRGSGDRTTIDGTRPGYGTGGSRTT